MRRLLLIARREYLSYLRTPGFWLSLLIAPMAAAFGGLAPQMMERVAPIPRICVLDLGPTGAGPAIERALQGAAPVGQLLAPPNAVLASADAEQAGRALRPYLSGGEGGPKPRLDAAVILTGAPDRIGLDFWSRDMSDALLEATVRNAVDGAMQQSRLRAAGLDPRLIEAMSTVHPLVRSFSPKAASGRVSMRDRLPTLLGVGMGFLLFFSIFTGAGILLNSVIEEKSTRVLEILLSSASVPEILGGKILGAAGLSSTVIAGWSAIGLATLNRLQPSLASDAGSALLSHGLAIWFLLFFVGGYLMYASVFAAIGAFCETAREAQTLVGPLMLVVMIPVMFLSPASQHPDAPVITALSLFPPFTPFLMTARLAVGPPLWQVVLALTLMAATAAGVVWLCARAFRAGALSTSKIDLRRLLSGAKH